MNLHAQYFESQTKSLTPKKNLVILHGLLGSGDNWKTIAQKSSIDRDVYCLDLPNHGLSDDLEFFDYSSLAQTVIDFIKDNDLKNCTLLGHSMGGKVAMQLAHDAPELIEKLIVVDIAPKHYENRHQTIFNAIANLDLTQITQRKQADQILSNGIIEMGVRQFILKSLSKNKTTGLFEWLFNWQFLTNQYEKIADAPKLVNKIDAPTLFIKGELSDYLSADDQLLILSKFTDSKARLIMGAGHWPHVEKQEVFMKELTRFL
ncbi:alpha/beta fold hydrolase [Marinicellulosiphila megalodicopiae]|uniref:alpha/beta fold hydrolase n=1 Tax=Marinicellulosiphila megalodicopiae TaxID=2724896 RepID=UPI003BAFB3C7